VILAHFVRSSMMGACKLTLPDGISPHTKVSLLYTLLMQHEVTRKRLSTMLLVLGPVTTLAISPSSSFDPINLVKMMFVSGTSFAAIAFMAIAWRSLGTRLPIGLWISAGFFVFWLTMVMIVSGAPLNQQFWGTFGRNNGYLAYFSLIVILLSVALQQKKNFYHKLVEALILTAIPTTIYALVQLVGRDPIAWSVNAPFATLGNINFSSAFFGLASISATILALAPRQALGIRIILISLAVTDLYIILETGSIQGFMIYVAGMGVAGFFVVRSHKSLRLFQIPYLILGVTGLLLTSLALKNIGPLARFVFGDTILFRFDYWYAGWAMTINNPIFGVGLDSYGDWYRELRGEIATLRTTPERITNTAHNIYLDISASGGFPLIVAYLILLGYAIRAAWKIVLRDQSFNPYFVALLSTWIAYLIQAAISINQIGVGIWGWLFTGALIGYEMATRDGAEPLLSNKTRGELAQIPAGIALSGILGFVSGVVIAFIPFHADARFKESLQFGSVVDQFTQAKSLGSTAFHLELALDAALKAGEVELADQITAELLARYPRDFMAWRVKQALVSSTPEERQEAYLRLRQMDPYNPSIRPLE